LIKIQLDRHSPSEYKRGMANAPLKTGIDARTLFPGRENDSMFKLIRKGARVLCVMDYMGAGRNYDKDYYEEVPDPKNYEEAPGRLPGRMKPGMREGTDQPGMREGTDQ